MRQRRRGHRQVGTSQPSAPGVRLQARRVVRVHDLLMKQEAAASTREGTGAMAAISRDAKARFALLAAPERQALEEEAERLTAVRDAQAVPHDSNEANAARAFLLQQAEQIFQKLGVFLST